MAKKAAIELRLRRHFPRVANPPQLAIHSSRYPHLLSLPPSLPPFPKEPAKGFCSRRKGSHLHLLPPPPRKGAIPSPSSSNGSDAICIFLHVFSCPRGVPIFFSFSKSVFFQFRIRLQFWEICGSWCVVCGVAGKVGWFCVRCEPVGLMWVAQG